VTRGRRFAGVLEELRRPNVSSLDRLFRITQRTLRSAGIAPHVDVNRCAIVELTAPPKVTRGFSDLVVRRAEERDVTALCAVNETPPELARTRLARGDLAYIGQVENEVLCHTWFHPGPTPFDEERRIFAVWEVPASTFWSFHAVALPEYRSSGLVAKLFQLAIRELFEVHRARKVRGFIHHTNEPSLAMHARLGFEIIGTVTAIASPTHKWLRWECAGVSRQWLLRRGSDFILSFPPA
jgi:RimJ/RimL family protein N-acetyltransferase